MKRKKKKRGIMKGVNRGAEVRVIDLIIQKGRSKID